MVLTISYLLAGYLKKVIWHCTGCGNPEEWYLNLTRQSTYGDQRSEVRFKDNINSQWYPANDKHERERITHKLSLNIS